jgi:hypothetical protein
VSSTGDLLKMVTRNARYLETDLKTALQQSASRVSLTMLVVASNDESQTLIGKDVKGNGHPAAVDVSWGKLITARETRQEYRVAGGALETATAEEETSHRDVSLPTKLLTFLNNSPASPTR